MLQKEISLSEVIEYYKANKPNSFEEDIDQFASCFVTATSIAALILASTPLDAIASFCSSIQFISFRASTLWAWLPESLKYKEKRREIDALERYKLASVVNFLLMQIAIKNALKEVIMPVLSKAIERIELEEVDKEALKSIAEKCDEKNKETKLPLYCHLSRTNFENYAFATIDPIFSAIIDVAYKYKNKKIELQELDLAQVKEKYIEQVIVYYNAFIINFSGEFPEFALWVEITHKEDIFRVLAKLLNKIDADNKQTCKIFLKETRELIQKIDDLRNTGFISENGFPSFKKNYEELFQIQTDLLVNRLEVGIRENIKAHHNKIKAELDKPLVDNQDIEGIVYPKNKDIYIAQSFRSIVYKKKEHNKGFLTEASLSKYSNKKQNIANYLLQTLINPNYATTPIIILGNPGAGKSMLSKMLAGLLCDTPDFIPFLIKLRNISSSTANFSEHINKGLAKSIENTADINWLDWAKKFKERIPVIIMDGFDELMQSSNTELNNYINAIKEFQDTVLSHGIVVRVILTSRKTVMHDVTIPDGTNIIILDSFDQSRKDLWVSIWNRHQTKQGYKFAIPNNNQIEHLAQEPLLLFMLAIYDFENSELQRIANDGSFTQSKLYDSLLNNFIERQLNKNSHYQNTNAQQKNKEKELFRLRLGAIALMMFLNDTTHRDAQKLSRELELFKLHQSQFQADNVLGSFFFIHENKAITEGEFEKINYEFLHKTFGEFLAADFMLRIAFKQSERSRETICQKYVFKFCFGYNWLHKHYNIQNFLFEHAPQISASNIVARDKIVNDIIKPDIEVLFEKGNLEFPVTENQIQPHKQVIEHLAIYSQNLIFLWLAISKDNEDIFFEIFGADEQTSEGNSEPKCESQDRDEINKNTLLWKRLAKLWTLVGNNQATAKLNEWINVVEKNNGILLSKRKSKVIHNFSDSARVACNDFELLLSFFDSEYKFSEENNVLEIIKNIVEKKPELNSLAVDAILYRFSDLFLVFKWQLLEWLINYDLHRRKRVFLIRKISALRQKWIVLDKQLLETLLFIANHKNFDRFMVFEPIDEYLKLLNDLTSYSIYEQLNSEINNIVYKMGKNFLLTEGENFHVFLQYFKLLNKLLRYAPTETSLQNFVIDIVTDAFIIKTIQKKAEIAKEYLNLLKRINKNRLDKKRIANKILYFYYDYFILNKTLISDTILIYLEFSLLLDNIDERKVQRIIVEELSRHEFEGKIIQKAILLLIKYNANPKLIEHLLDRYPKFSNIYRHSPEITRDILEIMDESD